MYDQINEVIEVVVSFKKNEVLPKFFSWRRKIYKIDKVHFVHTSQNSKGILYYFSVTDQINYFQLIFNPLTLTWTLSTMYNHG